eukprot:symbB.v1.2.000866.t1/scaffold38.1/size396883/6
MLSASFASERSWLSSFVPKLSEELRGKLVAHRGFHCPHLSDKRPLECTLPALQMAWNAGLRHCECDVRLSLDQKIIVLHDPNLDRLVKESAKPTPNANTLQAAELQRWPLCQEGVHIPLLEEVLKAALKSGSRLVIELKGSPGSSAVGSAVAQLFAEDSTLLEACALVMSFEVPELVAFAKSAPAESRPKLLLLTCHPSEGLEKKYQTLDLGDSAWEEQAKKSLSDLSLDGFYIEWTEKLSNQHSSAFQKLCQICGTVGVWQRFGQTDSEEEASLLLDLGASFCNTDLPKGFL